MAAQHPDTKIFSLGAVLSVTTGLMLCDMGELYDILNHLLTDDLMTHQLPRALRACAPGLARQHPQLVGVGPSEQDRSFWAEIHDPEVRMALIKEWVAMREDRHGKYIPVRPLSGIDYERKDPITELLDMGVLPERIVPIVVKEGG